MDKVRFAIVGCSKEAQLYAKAVSDASGAQLVAVCGDVGVKRDEFADLFTISSRDTILDAITYDHVDAVIIASSPTLHYDDTIDALNGLVHLLIAPPMAMKLEECTQMKHGAQEAQKVLSVIAPHRWYPSSMRIREAIDSGKLGTIDSGEAKIVVSKDEDNLLHQGLNQLDLLNYFLGPVAKVDNKKSSTQDTIEAIITYEDGAVISITIEGAKKDDLETTIRLYGDTNASVGFVAYGKWMKNPLNDVWSIEGEKELLQHFKDQDTAFFHSIEDSTYFLTLQIEDVVRAITTSSTPFVTGEDGKEAIKILEALQTGEA